MTERFVLHHGDCLAALRLMPDASVDSVVTDPPYGLKFMGKRWDHDVPGEDVWRECLRVLKPGGHLLAFAGTRTQHRMACAIEDAGFEVRDLLAWMYGSGFPKSHNGPWGGTALKPAYEPITMARKPLAGTVAANVAEYGTGALNVDGCRIGTGEDRTGGGPRKVAAGWGMSATPEHPAGRWPANVLLDEDAAAVLDAQSGVSVSKRSRRGVGLTGSEVYGAGRSDFDTERGHDDTGGASRFFYCAKASRRDREDGLCGHTARERYDLDASKTSHRLQCFSKDARPGHATKAKAKNPHPTVKPTDLMRWLCRLVTPPGGLVLDPFMGSGSTGKACMLEGLRFVGIEREAEYVEIARARIAAAVPAQPALAEVVP